MRSPSITGDQYSPKRAVACAIVAAVTVSIAPAAEPAANRTVRPGVACARRTATRMLAALFDATDARDAVAVLERRPRELREVDAPVASGDVAAEADVLGDARAPRRRNRRCD